MRTHTFVATAVLAAFVAAAPLASAQDRQRWPSRGNSGGGGGASQRDSGGGQRDSGGSSGRQRDSGSGQHDSGSGQRTAAPREGGRVQPPAPRDSGQTEQRAANGRREVAPRQPAQQDERQPQVSTPRGSTGNGGGGSDGRYDNGRYAGARYAVPRSGPVPYYRDGDHRVYAQPRQNYYVYRYPSYRYAYPYRYYGSPYPYYGYSYYDPGFTGSFYWSNHAWQPQAYYYGANYDYDLGKLRLDMEPREAEVYIDGYYAGIVDEFDGQLQGLRLQAGTYRVQVALAGFQPLDFDVRISSGRTTTYRGELNAEP